MTTGDLKHAQQHAHLHAQQAAAPEISILMTVYNTEEFLGEAIESVLRQQTLRRWELLIVDDGSTDSSLNIAQRYAARHPDRITVLQHPSRRNLGISVSRNLALSHARGRRVAFLDSDDVYLPHHCETLAAVLDTFPKVAMVYGAAERWVHHSLPFDEIAARAARWGQNYLPPLVPSGRRAGRLSPGTLVKWFQADESLVPCICSVMVTRQSALAVDGFCDTFRGLYDDQAFHAKMSRRFPIYALDTCVARYRQHPRSCCAAARTNPGLRDQEKRRFISFMNSLPALGNLTS